MSPDHYDSHLSAAELDRRDRIAADICAALTLASAHHRAAFLLAKGVKDDHPLCDAVQEYAAALKMAESALIEAAGGIESGRYQYIEAQRSPEAVGVAMQNGIDTLITGGR